MHAHTIELVIGLLAAMAAIALLAARLRIPYPILLVLGGLAISFIPGLPKVRIAPELVFLVFLPPLLYYAGLMTTWRDFKANLRPIVALAVGLVLITTVVVAGVAWYVVPGMTIAAAFALGAIVSPPDAVAATAVTSRLRVPRRIVTILEGESLVNDATALVAYNFAVAAVVTSQFSLAFAPLRFLVAAAGGVAVGYGITRVIVAVRGRISDPSIDGVIALLAPYFVYVPAEWLGVSGVLSAVTAGIVMSRRLPTTTSAATRLQLLAVWDVLVFVLNGALFILIGLHLPVVVRGLQGAGFWRLAGYASAISLAAILTRLAWVFVLAWLARTFFPRYTRLESIPSRRQQFLVGWAGMRGIVSLAAALALPAVLDDNVTPFPARDMIIFLSFGVIVATLVLQGLSLPPLIRLLHIEDDDAVTDLEERSARLDAAHAALARLQALSFAEDANLETIGRVTSEYEARVRALGGTLRDTFDPALRAPIVAANRVRREVLVAERQMITLLRDQNVIGDEVLRRLLREIDLDETRLASH